MCMPVHINIYVVCIRFERVLLTSDDITTRLVQEDNPPKNDLKS